MSEQQLAFFSHMRSLSYKMRQAKERTDRIHGVIARSQWDALALLSDSAARGASRRINYWRRQVQLAEVRDQAAVER